MSKISFIILLLCVGFGGQAQVKIGGTDGTPNGSAMFEVESNNKGILIPQIALTSATQQLQTTVANTNSLLIYNTATVVAEGLRPGYYYWKQDTVTPANSRWILMGSEATTMPKFFYMPSIVFNTTVLTPDGETWKRNLYLEYIAQFTDFEFVENTATGGVLGASPRATFKKSAGAPDNIPFLPNATDLWYYITDYDNSALSNLSITEDGILTYNVIGTGTDYSFVNIVFVVK